MALSRKFPMKWFDIGGIYKEMKKKLRTHKIMNQTVLPNMKAWTQPSKQLLWINTESFIVFAIWLQLTILFIKNESGDHFPE